ncbi:MAG: hypothetical protein ABSC77_12580 [Terracidiphilus sp.]|jgi:hypothetical protein
MNDKNPVAPVKKTYVKPCATKHAAASLVVGSTCGYYTNGYYVY